MSTSLVFVISTRGEIKEDLEGLLHEERVQELLLGIERGGRVKEAAVTMKLKRAGLLANGCLRFPIVLREWYEKMEPEVNSISEEISELIIHGLSGICDDSEVTLGIAAFGELDSALDEALLEEIRPLWVDGGEIIVCGFEGARPMVYRSRCWEFGGKLICRVEIGRPEVELRSHISTESPIFAGSDEMMDLAKGLLDWCLPDAELWAEEIGFSELKRDLFIYGFTKLVFNGALNLLGEKGKLPWDVVLIYEIRGI